MENKDIKNITEFFSEESPDLSPEQKWNLVFEGWINKIDKKELMSNLFELKLWFESLEELFSSSYLEDLVFKYQTSETRDYTFYLYLFSQVSGRIITLLKALDFEKDRYLLHFEEFIVEKILEAYTPKAFPYLKDIYSPESWFYNLRIFMQCIKHISGELTKNEINSQKTYSAIRKLFRKELMGNSLIISLMRGTFIAKMDKIYQKDICDIINNIEEDKKLKKHIGIFFILAFRIMKLNNFIELNLNKARNVSISIPLIVLLKKRLEHISSFYSRNLRENLGFMFKEEKEIEKVDAIFNDLDLECKKIFEGEFIYYFDEKNEKISRRKLLKNVTIISDFAIKELIENVARLFKPEISGSNIFENYKSRAEKAAEVKQKLVNLHTKINDFFAQKSAVNPADIFFDINQFIESDLNYLLFKDWNEFLNYYNKLVMTDFSPDFKANLKAFHSFITRVLKEMVGGKD